MTRCTQITIALALTGLVTAACTGDDKSDGLRPLALKEQASSVAKSGTGYVVSWAGVLKNANRWHFGENAVAVITATDAAGKQVVHMEQPLDAVAPGASLPFSGQVTTSAKPVRVKIDYRPATWRPSSRMPSAFLAFPTTDVATDRLPGDSYLVTGYVTDPFLKAADGLAVTAMLRNAAGKLMGGGTAYVDDVRSGDKRRFVITVPGVNGAVSKTDVLVTTWGATSKPYEELAVAGAVPIHTVAPTTDPFPKDRGYQAITDRRQ
ncbi:hypothetical protein Pth03_08340 [Planotetraspora thailandica]|uniref:Lipoprotein n=1 Tax=Planotetraspora thailandica TaxID=487172 RepID=A0A8J3XTT1_9ACTN|nr:hypothetical protein [Planotetraspora thailandica]GII52445.1 hypothetical protein Pth03_08340 [Planotetraspora thailandica]